jgi:hypothetical protein
MRRRRWGWGEAAEVTVLVLLLYAVKERRGPTGLEGNATIRGVLLLDI